MTTRMPYPQHMDSDDSFDYRFKIALIGEVAVGKSCVVESFSTGYFHPDLPAGGMSFITKTLTIDGKKVKLQVWDTFGNERLRNITLSYCRDASGIIIAYDITNKKTFSDVSRWIDGVQKHAGDNVVKILIGNKKDLENMRKVDFSEAQALAAHHDMMECLETSAKDSTNIEQVFLRLATELIRRQTGGLL